MKHYAKLITLLIISFVALVLCILNVFKVTDSAVTSPIIWAILAICNISNGITFFKKENKKSGIIYTVVAVICIVALVFSIIHLLGI